MWNSTQRIFDRERKIGDVSQRRFVAGYEALIDLLCEAKGFPYHGRLAASLLPSKYYRSDDHVTNDYYRETPEKRMILIDVLRHKYGTEFMSIYEEIKRRVQLRFYYSGSSPRFKCDAKHLFFYDSSLISEDVLKATELIEDLWEDIWVRERALDEYYRYRIGPPL